MNSFEFLVVGVLPYLTIPAFLIAMGYRVYVWAKTPQPGKMTLFPAPAGAMAKEIVVDALLFPRLFNSDRVLWFFSLTFHASLTLVVVGHFVDVAGLIGRLLIALGASPEGVRQMSAAVDGGAAIVLLATGFTLLLRRLTTSRLREISSVSDYFALLLLLAIALTGYLMRSVTGPVLYPLHALLGQVLLVYIPFSKILHLGGIFFTQALIQRR